MRKSEAIALLGGTVAAAAKEIGASYQAIDKWPDVLSRRLQDRVQAALYRRGLRAAAQAEASQPQGQLPPTSGEQVSLPLEQQGGEVAHAA